MEHDKFKEDQPSTSNKERLTPVDDAEKDDEPVSMDSETATSTSISIKSRMEISTARHKVSKPPIQKIASRNRNKKVKRSRIDKRYVSRRQPTKRVPTRRLKQGSRMKRVQSISTIFTRLSRSKTSINCAYCGHRCCRRRYEQGRRKYRRTRAVKRRLKIPKIKCIATQTAGSECFQVGSTCEMLSPLCVDTNAVPTAEQVTEEPTRCIEVSPQMIYEAVRCLTMWKQEVSTIAIFEHVKGNYPVIQDTPALFEELLGKLQVAAVVGIIEHTLTDRWCLSCALQKQRRITMHHVTLFWNTYGDTMRPITRKVFMTPVSEEDDEMQTSAAGQHFKSNSNNII